MMTWANSAAMGVVAGQESMADAVGSVPEPRPPPVPRNLHDEFMLALQEHRIAELEAANDLLGAAVLRADALLADAERAQQRQTAFLAVVAHELRRPLAPIRNAAELLGRIDLDDAGALSRLQAIIERQVVNISRLVDDLLDLSRANTGKLRLEASVVDLRAIVDEATQASGPSMRGRRQQLVVGLPSRPLQIHGDPVRLAQVLGNLLDNACRYTPEGGTIELLAEVAAGDVVVLSVSDNGMGIAAEALPHVFEPFAQELRSPGAGGSGLGLGLALVSELVEAHGGCVVAHSAGSGRGSRFVVTLPLSGADYGLPRREPSHSVDRP